MVGIALHPPPSRWIPIHRGSLSDVIVLRGELEANGIPADVPEVTIGIMDPFVRGGNVFVYELRVPERDVARALSVIERWKPLELQVAERLEHGPIDDGGTMPADAEGNELVHLRVRIRRMWWSSITAFFSPYCLALAPGYYRCPARSALSSRERWMTFGALVLALALTVPLIGILVSTFAAFLAPP